MPCRSDYYDDIQPPIPLINELRRKLDEATRAACTAMTAITDWENDGGGNILDDSLNINSSDIAQATAWFEVHVEEDKIRKEKLIQSAVDKLTPEEIEALGLTRHGKTS